MAAAAGEISVEVVGGEIVVTKLGGKITVLKRALEDRLTAAYGVTPLIQSTTLFDAHRYGLRCRHVAAFRVVP